MRDECGVMGIFSRNNEDIAQLIYYGLYALQHRGQESAGIAISKDSNISFYKNMGLVSDVFNADILNGLKGRVGIGHVRYSTTGNSQLTNAQPLVVHHKKKGIALAHNGNLVNAASIRGMLEDEGVIFQTTVDTEVIANMIARYYKGGIENAVRRVFEILKGAFALVITAEDKLIGVRDFYGLRPLCVGQIDDHTFVLASESCALDTIGAKLIRDVEPGEIVIIDDEGVNFIKSDKWCRKASCIFELIYFARPDSIMDGITANSYRYKCGRILAEESPVEADKVIPVPDSGLPAAIGFSELSGIPFGIGLIKNRYVGRTFIQPNQQLRELGVRIKLNVLRKNVEGKRIIMVDDSIVRGTTSKRLVELFKKAGAKEVHVRIAAPPVTHPCHFGIDTPSRKDLIGATKSIEEIRKMMNADTLAYLSVEGMKQATGKNGGFCSACFDGDYPMEVPIEGDNLKKK